MREILTALLAVSLRLPVTPQSSSAAVIDRHAAFTLANGTGDVSSHARRRRILWGCVRVTLHHADAAVGLQHGTSHFVHGRTARLTQRRLQFVMGKLRACQHVLEQLAIVNEQLRAALDQRLEFLTAQGNQAQHKIQRHQGRG